MTTRASANGTGTTEMEFEEEWEAAPPHHFQPNPYTQSEFEEEWEAAPPHHFQPNPYTQSEFEEEWEAAPPHHFQPNPYTQLYVQQEMEHPDRFIPLIAKAASKLLPHAVRLGRNL